MGLNVIQNSLCQISQTSKTPVFQGYIHLWLFVLCWVGNFACKDQSREWVGQVQSPYDMRKMQQLTDTYLRSTRELQEGIIKHFTKCLIILLQRAFFYSLVTLVRGSYPLTAAFFSYHMPNLL